jgi:hypothetical protein
MIILLNGKTLEPGLPEVTMTPVMPMVAADMTGHPPLHERTECVRSRGLQHEMKMIRHQTEGKERTGNLVFAISSSERNAA